MQVFDRIVNHWDAVLAKQPHEGQSRQLSDFGGLPDAEPVSSNVVDRPEATQLGAQLGHVTLRNGVLGNPPIFALLTSLEEDRRH